MKIAIPKERRADEKRVAATPDTVKKYIALGLEVVVETGAGVSASIPDDLYVQAGATIAKDARTVYDNADIVLKVQKPLRKGEGDIDELALMKKGAILLANMSPYQSADDIVACAEAGIDAFSLELVPRITRAQSMDVLSSQSNLAGYKAVLDAAAEYSRAFPMMMTAAGTVAPARVVVMGAGVAGLQAIATAKRLGAVVSAFDVRRAAKEQVESLGATFIEVEGAEDMETSGGYAKEATEDYKRRQAEKIKEVLKKTDIVICTALIPGKAAPLLIPEDYLVGMKPGSVIIDLAVESGGNCAGSKPGEIVEKNGVKIVGHRNVPSRLAADAAALYAKNLLNFLTPHIDKDSKALAIKWEDEIILGTALTRDGQIIHPNFVQLADQVKTKPAKAKKTKADDEAGPAQAAQGEAS